METRGARDRSKSQMGVFFFIKASSLAPRAPLRRENEYDFGTRQVRR